MNAKISVFVVCVEAIIYLLLYDLHDCTFKTMPLFIWLVIFRWPPEKHEHEIKKWKTL